jgi:hypothetical protein
MEGSSMRDFLEKLALAVVPLLVGHWLDVRKAKVIAATDDAETSFAAYVRRAS